MGFDRMTSLSPSVFIRPRVLVFCRPYLVSDFQANVAPLTDSFDFRFFTDGRSPGTTDTRARFYGRLGKASQPHGFTEDDELDILERCRYLRNLPRGQAIDMLRAMASAVEEEFDSYGPHVVLSHMVDDYVTHLIAEIARRRGIVYVGFAYSYFPAKAQVTQYGSGEPLDVREPSNAEVEHVLAQISERTFRQNYLQKDTYTHTRHLKAMLRYRMKQIVFKLKAWADRDPLHMHYSCLPYVVERRYWRDFPSVSDFHSDWLDRIQSAIAINKRPIVYFPLGYFPEATIDYWIEDRRFLDYQNVVIDICRTLSRHSLVVVKEHLHMLGARSPDFYRTLRDIPGAISVPPLEFSNDVLNGADVVIIGAGSIGVESFIRGKPIVSFCDRSYWFAHAKAFRVDLSSLDRWSDVIQCKMRTHVEPSQEERFEFIRQCLRSTMRVERAGLRWPICSSEDLKRALQTALRTKKKANQANDNPVSCTSTLVV
jgi:hypothetical protein